MKSTDVLVDMLNSSVEIIKKYDALPSSTWINKTSSDKMWKSIMEDVNNSFFKYINCQTEWASEFAKQQSKAILDYFEQRQKISDSKNKYQ